MATGSAHGMQIIPANVDAALSQPAPALHDESSFGSPDGQIISVKPINSRVHIGKTPPNPSAAISSQGPVNIMIGSPPGLVAELSAQLEATRAEAREVIEKQHTAHQQEKVAMREEAVRVVAASQIDANARVSSVETQLQGVQDQARQHVAGIQAHAENQIMAVGARCADQQHEQAIQQQQQQQQIQQQKLQAEQLVSEATAQTGRVFEAAKAEVQMLRNALLSERQRRLWDNSGTPFMQKWPIFEAKHCSNRWI